MASFIFDSSKCHISGIRQLVVQVIDVMKLLFGTCLAIPSLIKWFIS